MKVCRDWCFDWSPDGIKSELVLRNQILPLFHDNIRDYKHAHLMWVREGKWSYKFVFNCTWSLFLETNSERLVMDGKWKQK